MSFKEHALKFYIAARPEGHNKFMDGSCCVNVTRRFKAVRPKTGFALHPKLCGATLAHARLGSFTAAPESVRGSPASPVSLYHPIEGIGL